MMTLIHDRHQIGENMPYVLKKNDLSTNEFKETLNLRFILILLHDLCNYLILLH